MCVVYIYIYRKYMYWQENIEFWPPFTFFVVLLVMNDKVVFVSVKKEEKIYIFMKSLKSISSKNTKPSKMYFVYLPQIGNRLH